MQLNLKPKEAIVFKQTFYVLRFVFDLTFGVTIFKWAVCGRESKVVASERMVDSETKRPYQMERVRIFTLTRVT